MSPRRLTVRSSAREGFDLLPLSSGFVRRPGRGVHHISPILVGAPPAADYPGRTGPEPATQIVALNQWVAGYCASSHFAFLDYYSALVGSHGQMKEGVSDDGVHPNGKGYSILRPLTEKAIADVLKQRANGAATARER